MLKLFKIMIFSVCVLSFSASYSQETWRFSLQHPETDPMTTHMKNFAENISKNESIDVNLEVFPGSSLFRQGAELVALQRDNLDISLLSAADIEQQIPEYSIWSSGYLFRDYAHFRKVFNGEIKNEIDEELLSKADIKLLGVLYSGTRHIFLRNNLNVKSPEDLKGVKLRMPAAPAWLKLGEGLGVNPTPMSLSEVYLALKTGAIDGQENPLTLSRVLKFEEVTKEIVMSAHMFQSTFMVVSKKSWENLNAEQQQAMQDEANKIILAQDEERIPQEEQDLEYFKNQGLVISYPDINVFRSSVKKMFDDSGISSKWPEGLAQRIENVE